MSVEECSPRKREVDPRELAGTSTQLAVFGYGSLIWKLEEGFEHPRPALVRGFLRRLWQGSPDHRGTPEAPGLVATLVRVPLVRGVEPITQGILYSVRPDAVADVLGRLCIRERAGYECVEVQAVLPDGTTCSAVTFSATPANEQWVGPQHWIGRAGRGSGDGMDGDCDLLFLDCARAGCSGCAAPRPAAACSAAALARVVSRARGTSGTSLEYLSSTRAALAQRGVTDSHLDDVWAELCAAADEAVTGAGAQA